MNHQFSPNNDYDTVPQQYRQPQEDPPAFVPWSVLETYNTGLLPQVLFAAGVLLMAAGIGASAVGRNILWLFLGVLTGCLLLAASAVVRSIRHIEANTANLYKQMEYRNKRQ